jgi:hypothetical protein
MNSQLIRFFRTAALLAGMATFLAACHHHWGHHRHHHRGDLPLTLQAETPSNLR